MLSEASWASGYMNFSRLFCMMPMRPLPPASAPAVDAGAAAERLLAGGAALAAGLGAGGTGAEAGAAGVGAGAGGCPVVDDVPPPEAPNPNRLPTIEAGGALRSGDALWPWEGSLFSAACPPEGTGPPKPA